MSRVKKINLQVGGSTTTLELGDLFSADFSSLEEPKCSVKSLQEWAIQVTRILKGVSPEPPVDCESMAEAAGITPTATTTVGDVVTALNNKGASINPNTGTIQDCINAI